MCFFEKGNLQVLQHFNVFQHPVLPMVFLVTAVPTAFRTLTLSSREALG